MEQVGKLFNKYTYIKWRYPARVLQQTDLNGSKETQLQFHIMTGSFVLFDLRTAEICIDCQGWIEAASRWSRGLAI